ncbi:MAG: hypothetical protein HZA08_05915 [Nitrospirae bacterium]|nr:hypothetical protein [Nitrospirota bacterium]
MSLWLTKGHENQRDRNVPPILIEMDRQGFPTPPEVFSVEGRKVKLQQLFLHVYLCGGAHGVGISHDGLFLFLELHEFF